MSNRRVAVQRTGSRILDAAVDLFNTHGTSSVTTNHIAAHIGISPGNLYYWYSDKQQIVRALWQRLAAERGGFWETGHGIPGPDEAIRRLAASAAVGAARYGFLMRELPALARADGELRAASAGDRDRRRAILATFLRSWRADGALLPVTDAELAGVLDVLWLVTETAGQIVARDAPSTAADVERLLRVVVMPYLAPERRESKAAPDPSA